MDTNKLDRPASWGETLLALGPFLLFAAFFAFVFILPFFLNDMNSPTFGLVAQLTLVVLMLTALFAGWVKGFPRWVFPYWGFALIITLYLYGFNGTISGYPFRGETRYVVQRAAYAQAPQEPQHQTVRVDERQRVHDGVPVGPLPGFGERIEVGGDVAPCDDRALGRSCGA